MDLETKIELLTLIDKSNHKPTAANSIAFRSGVHVEVTLATMDDVGDYIFHKTYNYYYAFTVSEDYNHESVAYFRDYESFLWAITEDIESQQ